MSCLSGRRIRRVNGECVIEIMRNKWINKNEKYKVQSRRDQIIHIIPICSKGRDQQKKNNKN